MDYLGRHKIMLGVVGLLAAVSALAALLGTYMIRPIVNGVLENGSKRSTPVSLCLPRDSTPRQCPPFQ